LAKFADSVTHLCQAETLLLSMKTGLSEGEARELGDDRYLMQETELRVPGIIEKRSLVSLKFKAAATAGKDN